MIQNLEDRVKALEEKFNNLVMFLSKTPYFNADVLQSAVSGKIAEEEDKIGKLM